MTSKSPYSTLPRLLVNSPLFLFALSFVVQRASTHARLGCTFPISLQMMATALDDLALAEAEVVNSARRLLLFSWTTSRQPPHLLIEHPSVVCPVL
jgi:hypothetical protein